jgi:hypothetical protein
MAKNVLVDALVDGDAAAAAGAFGGPFRAGSVSLEREGQRLVCTVGDGAGPLATLVLPALRAIDPAMLRWDPWLGYQAHEGVPRLVEYAPQPGPTEAFLSKGATLEIAPGLPRGHRWRAFRNLLTISACYEEGELTLGAPVVQQPLA